MPVQGIGGYPQNKKPARRPAPTRDNNLLTTRHSGVLPAAHTQAIDYGERGQHQNRHAQSGSGSVRDVQKVTGQK